MQTIRFTIIGVALVAFAGCAGDINAPPMETDGPNQVVLKVPGMS